MTSSIRYRVNTPTIIHDKIEGEVIVANLAKGLYYSLDSTATAIWSVLGCGATVAEIVDSFCRRAGADRSEVVAAVTNLVAQLQTEALVVVDDAEPSSDAPDTSFLEGLSFVPLVLHKYTDMEEILMLDPVHDVDDTGWPNPAPTPPRPSGGGE